MSRTSNNLFTAVTNLTTLCVKKGLKFLNILCIQCLPDLVISDHDSALFKSWNIDAGIDDDHIDVVPDAVDETAVTFMALKMLHCWLHFKEFFRWFFKNVSQTFRKLFAFLHQTSFSIFWHFWLLLLQNFLTTINVTESMV